MVELVHIFQGNSTLELDRWLPTAEVGDVAVVGPPA